MIELAYWDGGGLHPIDIVQELATDLAWDFRRMGDDKIALVIEGKWRMYSVTMDWSPYDEQLRFLSTFEMEPPEDRLPHLEEVIKMANGETWSGIFEYWGDQLQMAHRYGLKLPDGLTADSEQVRSIIVDIMMDCERFYPAFQLATWGKRSPGKAIEVAMTEAYGRA